MPQVSTNKIRLNLDLTPEVRATLEEVQVRTGAASLTEVIRRALAVYDYFTEETRTGTGTTIILRTESGAEKTVKLI